MKKVLFVISSMAVLATVLITGIVIVFNLFFEKTDFSLYNKATFNYNYGDINIYTELTQEDYQVINRILNDRILSEDNPSCGFDEDNSIEFGSKEKTVYIACDTCPVFKDLNSGMYFRIRQSERETLNKILEKYGAKYPCV